MIKTYGIWLICGGTTAMIAAYFLMVPGVETGPSGGGLGIQLPSSVFNFGKAQQQNLVFAGGATSVLTGAVLYGAGVLEDAIMRAGGFRRRRSSVDASAEAE